MSIRQLRGRFICNTPRGASVGSSSAGCGRIPCKQPDRCDRRPGGVNPGHQVISSGRGLQTDWGLSAETKEKIYENSTCAKVGKTSYCFHRGKRPIIFAIYL